MTCPHRHRSSANMINRPNTSKRKRRRRCSSIISYWAAVLVSIICIIERVSSFSNQPSSINDRSSIPDIRWHTSTTLHQQSSSSSSTSSSDNTLVSKASIKGAIATSISTNEQISQLEKHALHTKQTRSKQYKSSKKYKSKGKHRYNNKKKSKNYYHTSKTQNKKRKVRHLYSQAKSYEKQGKWKEATKLLYDILIIEPNDSHSYLALAKLQSRRDRGLNVGSGSGGGGRVKEGEIKDSSTHHDLDISLVQTKATTTTKQQQYQYKNARQIFQVGTTNCPKSIHLWHAWGMYELSLSNPNQASELFAKALEIDPYNGYVNHALGSLEVQYNNNSKRGEECYLKGLQQQPSAALVCSLGELYIKNNTPDKAQSLYTKYIPKIYNEREKMEVYLAASSLEERVYNNIDKASQLLKEALQEPGGKDSGTIVHDSRAYIALARLGTSNGLVDDTTVKKRLKEICIKQLKHHKHTNKSLQRFPVKDGRLFNAWAKLESKTNLQEARKILARGMKMYPKDYTLLQAAGNIEERLGHVEKARELYGASLSIEINVPTLISYGLLELRSPEKTTGVEGEEKKGGQDPNITMVRKLFNEALLIDPKHGPLYNAYGNLELKKGNTNRAKELYEAGINANCTDASSVYHGLAKLHLKLGDVDTARSVLQRGLALFDTGDGSGGSNAIDDMKNNTKGGKTLEKQQQRQHHSAQQQNENVAFLAHTLAMIELKFNNNPTVAKSVLNQGLYHSPNSPQLLLAMALSESRMNNESAARSWFERSLRSDQCHAQAWQAFGVMEMTHGNFRTAKTLFECGIKNVPGHGALWQAYGTLESWRGDIGKARLLFAAGIEKCPQHVPLYQAWACLELRSGDVLTAKRLISEALTRDKTNGEGWLVAAKIEEKMDNQGLVGLILRRGIECSPLDTELYRALADHEISRGRIDSARELLEQGIEINPLYAPLYHSLAELEARIFNLEGLAKLNKRTAEIFPSDAMAPPTNRMEELGKKMKLGRSSKLPDGVAALAEKIGVDSESNVVTGVDPETLVNSMCGFGHESNALMFHDLPEGIIDSEDNA